MPIRTAIWRVADPPVPLADSYLATEQLLEDMIVASPGVLSDEWMLIGRQEATGFGGRIDLLALAPDGSLVLIELKRERTPREVVAQALDYAGWVERLRAEDIARIYERFASETSLTKDFKANFGTDLDEADLNQNHQIVIVASSLDDSTERIVAYLREREIPINVLCFQIFSNGSEQLLSRTWLHDPNEIQAISSGSKATQREPWNGEFYCSYSFDRSWKDAVRFGFISGGGGPWYSRTLQLLNPGDRVWVNVPGYGYVGVGLVKGRVQPAKHFKVRTSNGDVFLPEAATNGKYARDIDDLENCEYFVPIKWAQTVDMKDAFQEVGLFGNQNTICRPTTPKWRATVERLKTRFPEFDRLAKESA